VATSEVAHGHPGLFGVAREAPRMKPKGGVRPPRSLRVAHEPPLEVALATLGLSRVANEPPRMKRGG
jgi:hypothetical protein